jgi:S-DNA-T family DNA segregation ATPase FtsK/SpoIIIE
MSTKKALPAKARQSAKSKQKQMQLRRRIVRREACGVGLIALGLLGFLSILPIEMGMLGAGIKNLLFGLLGFTAFVIPLGTILVGGMVIYARAQNLPYPKIICVGVLTVLLLVFGHLIALDAFDRTNFKTFVADAYRIGRLQGLGTGALGAIFTYPIVLLVGKVGAYILTAAAVICCLLVLTRLSLAQVGQKTAQAARTTAVIYRTQNA